MRFLIARLSALGDVVCSLPVASALKDGHPGCEIVWVVDPRFRGIVECCPDVDEVVVAKPGLRPATWPRYEKTFDAALDVQGLLKSALCVARARAERKVGFHWQREGANLFSQPVPPDPTSYHVVDQYVDVARSVGGIAESARFALRPEPGDLAKVRERVEALGRFVLMNAGAGWATKRWRPDGFALVADRLAERGVATVLLGGRAEEDRSAAAEVVAAAKAPIENLVGETSVRELVALVSLAAAHLGGDTGSSHLAAALGVPAVGLYSITRPERSCPYGQIDRCCYNPDSLARIEPEEPFEKLCAALSL